eukprot:1694806-Rhodomonas_salina.1
MGAAKTPERKSADGEQRGEGCCCTGVDPVGALVAAVDVVLVGDHAGVGRAEVGRVRRVAEDRRDEVLVVVRRVGRRRHLHRRLEAVVARHKHLGVHVLADHARRREHVVEARARRVELAHVEQPARRLQRGCLPRAVNPEAERAVELVPERAQLCRRGGRVIVVLACPAPRPAVSALSWH